MCLASQETRYEYWLGRLLSRAQLRRVKWLGCVWRQNIGLLGLIYMRGCRALALEKFFYLSFQVILLASLVMVYQQDHLTADPQRLKEVSFK